VKIESMNLSHGKARSPKATKLFSGLTIGCISLLISQISILGTAPALASYPENIISQAQNANTPPPPPPPPPDEPAPGGRVRGGAKRGNCPVASVNLAALVPYTETKPAIVNVWGLTTKERPTLWFYVPITQDHQHPVEFILQDQDSNPIYQQDVTLPNQPGIIGITLPANAPPLALNQRYRWFFNVYCDRQQQLPPVHVEGVIKLVNLSQTATNQMTTAQPLEKIAIYQENGIWHDQLTLLAQLLQQDPQNAKLQTQWQDVLTRVGFAQEAKQPIIFRQ
jgi:hypothetical protein